MTDIVQRLRHQAKVYEMGQQGPLYAESADEIERLRKENSRLFGALNDYEATLRAGKPCPKCGLWNCEEHYGSQ